MNKSDLRTGHIVRLRKGGLFFVVLNTVGRMQTNRLFNVEDGAWLDLDYYEENLIDTKSPMYSIDEVCTMSWIGDIFTKGIDEDKLMSEWKRGDEEFRKVELELTERELETVRTLIKGR